MTEPDREMANSLLDSIDAQFVAGIARESRELARAGPCATRSTRRPSTAEEHEEAAGLIDGVAYRDELLAKLGDRRSSRPRTTPRVDPADVGFDPTATLRARSTAAGTVVRRHSGSTRARARRSLASDDRRRGARGRRRRTTTIKADRASASTAPAARRSPRISSGTRCSRRGKRKPVDRLVLGRRGVGRLLRRRGDRRDRRAARHAHRLDRRLRAAAGARRACFEKLDIGYDSLTRGAHADMLLSRAAARAETLASAPRRGSARRSTTSSSSASPTGRSRSTARGRRGRAGRVWTGAQGVEIGLVDELGGLRAAVAKLAQGAGSASHEDADVALVPFPPPRPLLEQIARRRSVRRRRTRRALPSAGAAAGARRDASSISWLEALERARRHARAAAAGRRSRSGRRLPCTSRSSST